MSRGLHFLLDGNTKGYEVVENISKKGELNPLIVSTAKFAKSI